METHVVASLSMKWPWKSLILYYPQLFRLQQNQSILSFSGRYGYHSTQRLYFQHFIAAHRVHVV